MHSPAFAIAWQLWTRHRPGIVAALVMLAATIVVSPLLPMVVRITASSIALVVAVAYFMNILLFTETVGSMESNYSRRMFALPVTNRALAGWPMLYGGGVVGLLWMTVACLVFRPSGFRIPVFLPALGLAAILIWLQAFAWAPIKNHLLKVALPVGLIPLLIALPVWMYWMAPPDVFWSWITGLVAFTLLVMVIATAYAVAVAGIASDRRGDTWHVLPRNILDAFHVDRPAPVRSKLRSPAHAQFWYEWKCHGVVIPFTCAGLVLLMFGPTFLSGRHGPGGLQTQLLLLLLLPVFLTGPLSVSVGNLRPSWVKPRGFITFLATRPMSSGALVFAKMRMMAVSVLLTFAILVVEIALWIVAVGSVSEAVELWRLFLTSFPGGRAAAVLVLGALTLVALTWSQATACLPIVLTGRNAIFVGFNLAVIAGGFGFGGAVVVLSEHPALLSRLIASVPALAIAAIVIKLSVASLAFRACLRYGLIRLPSLFAILAGSLGLAACAMALAALLSDARMLPVPMSAVLLAIVLLVPLGRFGLAPLALEYNRHR